MSRSNLLKGIAGKLSILMGTAVLASTANAAASVPSFTADNHNDSIQETAAAQRKHRSCLRPDRKPASASDNPV